jgi:hypothetical protein
VRRSTRAGAVGAALHSRYVFGLGAEADQELRDIRLAVTHHARVGHAARAHHAADGAFFRPALLETHLHLGAAGEVDAEMDALDEDGRQRQQEQQSRRRKGVVPPSDEVDVGPGRDDLEGHL